MLHCILPKDIWPLKMLDISTIHLAPVVQMVDSTIHRINLCPVDIAILFPSLMLIHLIVIYLMDRAIHLLNSWGQLCPYSADMY